MTDININIQYKETISRAMVNLIRNDIQDMLQDKKTEYDNLLGAFVTSECMHATAVRSMIAKEKDMVDVLINFYTQLLQMIENASRDIEKTEEDYSKSHLTKE